MTDGDDAVKAERHIGDSVRRRRLPALVAALALPIVAGCSSSPSIEYATDAYPSQSLVDLLKGANNSPPPVQSAAPPAPGPVEASPPPTASAAPAGQPPPVPGPPPVATTAAVSPPPVPATPPEEFDPVAAAFPSVSLIDLITGAPKP